MLSAPKPTTYATDIAAARPSSAFDNSSHSASPASDAEDQPPQSLRKGPTRHYTTLQEHADQILETDASRKDESVTPRHVGRREGFSWGQQQQQSKNQRQNRHPMTMEHGRQRSPPSLEEIIRRSTVIDDADDIQNNKLRHVDSIESRGSTAMRLADSFSSNASDYYPHDNRRSSIVAFAKGIARHVPDLRVMYPPENKHVQQRRDSKDDSFSKLQKKDRAQIFAPSPSPRPSNSHEVLPKPAVVIDEPPRAVEISTTPSSPQSPATNSGLRARRKVQLDLAMPDKMPDLPARGRYPADVVGNLGAPRSRSPKTPWIRNEQPKWTPDRMVKSMPIKEEDYIGDAFSALRSDSHSGKGLLPGNDAMSSSQSPKLELPPLTVRDRRYMGRQRPRRSPSGRSHHSGTSASDSTAGHTPDGSWIAADEIAQAHTKAELQKMAQETKKTRACRWKWRNMTSSDDAPQPSGQESFKRRLSINPFKRSNRLADQAALENSGQNLASAHALSRSKQDHYDCRSLSHMHAPPTFVPPGLNRVPTPPIFDANGEVKGKLADFLFDFQSSGMRNQRNRPTSSSEGYWDSDALLMSLSTDLANLDNDEEDDEEGPEGPLKTSLTMNNLSPPSSRFLVPDKQSNARKSSISYLGVKPPLSPSLAANAAPMLGHDGWYRVNHERGAHLRDARTVAALARQEEEERRKFEWLVPEHLPNSPLCPLHEKYGGAGKGLCYWHGRRSGDKIRGGEYARPDVKGNGWRTGFGPLGEEYTVTGAGEGETGVVKSPGIGGPLAKEAKKRRLVSFSSP